MPLWSGAGLVEGLLDDAIHSDRLRAEEGLLRLRCTQHELVVPSVLFDEAINMLLEVISPEVSCGARLLDIAVGAK